MTLHEKALENAAMASVIAVRGSNDAPGFDACVKAEMETLRPLIRLYLLAIAEDEAMVEAVAVALQADYERPRHSGYEEPITYKGQARAALRALARGGE